MASEQPSVEGVFDRVLGDVLAEALPQLGQEVVEVGVGVVGHREPDLVHEVPQVPREVGGLRRVGSGTP